MKKPQDPASASNEMAEKLRIWHQNFIDGGGVSIIAQILILIQKISRKKTWSRYFFIAYFN